MKGRKRQQHGEYPRKGHPLIPLHLSIGIAFHIGISLEITAIFQDRDAIHSKGRETEGEVEAEEAG